MKLVKLIQNSLKHKKFYTLVAITVVVFLNISIISSIMIKADASAEIKDTTPAASTQPDQNTCNSNSSSDAPNSEGNTLLTEQQALNIATPLIQQYSQEHNRVIVSVNAAFSPNVRDLTGSRGGSSIHDLGKENVTWLSFPSWEVVATFEGEKDSVTGYSVLIWADNGQIRSAGEQANY